MVGKSLAYRLESDASKDLKLKPGPQTARLADIRLRVDPDTRPLNPSHVYEMAQSIAVLGLLEPLVIDTHGHLLAGAHRFAALQLLAITDPDERQEWFLEHLDSRDENNDKTDTGLAKELAGKLAEIHIEEDSGQIDEVPVRVVEISGDKAESAKFRLAIEVAENSVRRQYTNKEIVDLANRLQKAGYRVGPGAPKKDETPAMDVLEAAVGLSRRQLRRILHPEEEGRKTSDPLDTAAAALRRAALRLSKAAKDKSSDSAKKLRDLARQVLKEIPKNPKAEKKSKAAAAG